MSNNDLKNLGKLMANKTTQSKASSKPSKKPAKPASNNAACTLNNLVLKRPISITCWRIKGEVSEAEARKELHAVLLRVQERGSADAADIAEHLLREKSSRKVVAKRLLDILLGLGLVKSDHDSRERQQGYNSANYSLTDAGKEAISKESVFVPEQGTWTVWASDDPLLPTSILSIESYKEARAIDETGREGKEKSEARRKNMGKIPNWLAPENGQPRAVLLPSLGGSVRRLDSVEGRGEKVEQQSDLQLIWNTSKETLQLVGTIDETKHKVDSFLENTPHLNQSNIWQMLLHSIHRYEDWSWQKQHLREEFSDTTDTERSAMQRSLHFQNPQFDELGRFDSVDVNQVNLAASIEGDAKAWANWRLQNAIGDYATTTLFQQEWQRAVEPFADFSLTTPDREALAITAWPDDGSRPPSKAWHLMAAEDWEL